MSALTNTFGTQIVGAPISENSGNTQTTQGSGNTESLSGIGSASYNVSGSSNVAITAADFGAIQAAQNIATTSLQTAQAGVAATLSGLDTLSSLTGQALLLNSRSVSDQNQPVSVTIAKGAAVIVAIGVIGWALVKIVGAFFGSKNK